MWNAGKLSLSLRLLQLLTELDFEAERATLSATLTQTIAGG